MPPKLRGAPPKGNPTYGECSLPGKIEALSAQLEGSPHWEDLLYHLAQGARDLTKASSAGALLSWEEAGLVGLRAHLGAWEAPAGEVPPGQFPAWLSSLAAPLAWEEGEELPDDLGRVLGMGKLGPAAVAPLRHHGGNIGLVYTHHPEVGSLREASLALEGLAAWGGAALAGMAARLEREETAATLAALKGLTEALARGREPREAWEEFLRELVLALQGVESGAIYIGNGTADFLGFCVAYGAFAEKLSASSQERFRRGFGPQEPTPSLGRLDSPGEPDRQLIQLPLASGGELRGILSLAGLPKAVLSRSQAQLLRAVAEGLGLALLAGEERALREKHRRYLSSLSELDKAAATLERQDILEFALVGLAKALPCDLTGLLLAEGTGAQMLLHRLKAIAQPSLEEVQTRLLECYRRLAGREVDPGRPMLRGAEGAAEGRAIESYLVLPLLAGSNILGLLSVNSIRPGAFDEEDLRFLSLVASRIGSSLREANLIREAQHLAITDELTNLYNFRALRGVLVREVALALRHKYSLSLVILDIDGLKEINDTYGHLAGNRALSELAAVIRAVVRHTDVAARLGGDEFAIVMPHTSRQGAQVLVRRLRRAIAEHTFRTDGQEMEIGVSIGVATLEALDDKNALGLIQAADQDLYREKRQKRLALGPRF